VKPENQKKLAGILTYHAVSGEVPAAKVVKLSGAKTLNGQQVDIAVVDGKVKLDNATVVTTDIKCSNGIIHVIDSVILPAESNLAETAVKAGSFSTLVAAAKAADLLSALTGTTELTVFAPTDEAFAKLPAGTVENLLKPENKAKLAEILKYHVVAGRVYSSDAVAAKSAETLQGQSISISVGSSGAFVNDAKLLKTDIDASNGVIHVIDSVLLPSEKAASHSPRRMIESAISQGAPLYNAGHHAACAKVYMNTVESLMQMEELPSHAKHSMEAALSSARSTTCSNTQAWTLRHALDNAYRMASRN
jgi:uncharacterized surface protein with fasciclin (FAS1) repeats